LNTAYEDDERPPAPDPARIAAHRVGVEEPHVSGYGFRGICLIDPDGYELNFHWPVTDPVSS
jgi:hypothetical protein